MDTITWKGLNLGRPSCEDFRVCAAATGQDLWLESGNINGFHVEVEANSKMLPCIRFTEDC